MTESTASAEDEISLKELIVKLKEWVTYLLSKFGINEKNENGKDWNNDKKMGLQR